MFFAKRSFRPSSQQSDEGPTDRAKLELAATVTTTRSHIPLTAGVEGLGFGV